MLQGLCSFTDVTESRVDLADLALMNELLDLQSYNDRLLTEARQAPVPPPSDPAPAPRPNFYVPAGFRR